jgi:hypothetical protein
MTQATITAPAPTPAPTMPTTPPSLYQPALRFSLVLPHTESYYPTPRHKKTSERPAEAKHTYCVNCCTRQEAPIVMVERIDQAVYAYRLYRGQLYREAKTRDNTDYITYHPLTLDALIATVKENNYPRWSLERNQAQHEKMLEHYLVVGSTLYEKHLEPRYSVDRSGLRIGYGLPDQPHLLPTTFNALEYHTAYSLANPVIKSPRARRLHKKKAPHQEPTHTLKVFDPSAVQIPANAQLSQHFDNLEIQRGAVSIMDKLGQYPQRLRAQILERCIDLLVAAQKSN